MDHEFRGALQLRVSDTNRWTAFLEGRGRYEGAQCPKCQSTRRRVRDCSCYDCMLGYNRSDWDSLLSGISPRAKQTRGSYLDRLERARRERRGQFERLSAGEWTGRQYPTGRLAVSCSNARLNGTGPDGQRLERLPDSPLLVIPFGTSPATLAFECPDLQKAEPRLVYGLAERNPDFLILLRRAGWAD